jgi:hypothetical protein
VFEVLTRHLGQKLGIELAFPSIESLMLDKLEPEGKLWQKKYF